MQGEEHLRLHKTSYVMFYEDCGDMQVSSCSVSGTHYVKFPKDGERRNQVDWGGTSERKVDERTSQIQVDY